MDKKEKERDRVRIMTRYIIECWNPYTKKYDKFWVGNKIEKAEIMFNKPYYKTRTRRLIKINEEILYTEKSSQKS